MTLAKEKGFICIVCEQYSTGFCEPRTRVESVSKIYGVNNRKTIAPHSETVQYSSLTNVETDENTKQERMLTVGIGH